MAVAHIFAQAHVGDDVELGPAVLDQAHGLLHDAVFGVCAGGFFVFGFGYAKQDEGFKAGINGLFHLFFQLGEAELILSGHALDTYLPKLIRSGKRVAICDQLEDPKLTKKLVKRGITELVTPGISINSNILNYKENNFLAAVHFGKAVCGVAFLDISTGEFLTAEGTYDYVDKLLNNFAPKEVVFERGRREFFQQCFGTKYFTYELDDWVFTENAARERLLKHFETKNLKGFGVEHLHNGIIASGAVLEYLIMKCSDSNSF